MSKTLAVECCGDVLYPSHISPYYFELLLLNIHWCGRYNAFHITFLATYIFVYLLLSSGVQNYVLFKLSLKLLLFLSVFDNLKVLWVNKLWLHCVENTVHWSMVLVCHWSLN